MRALIAVLAVSFSASGALSAQRPSGTNLSVTVRVSRIIRSGDTVTIEYHVRNDATSGDSLWTFTVEAGSAAISIEADLPRGDWSGWTRYGSVDVAHWALLEHLVGPGGESAALRYRALGVPGITVYYAGGDWPVPPYQPVNLDTIPRVSERGNLASHAVRGLTVGIEPQPPDRSPGALNERLRAFLSRACALGWISNAGVCNSLQVKLDQAARSLERGNGTEARRQLGAFLEELEAQHGPEPGKHVNNSAYWLLKINVEYLLGRM